MPNDLSRDAGRPPRLVVALSPHGFGHAGMTAPVVEALRRRLPGLELILQTTLPPDWLRDRFAEPFTLVAELADFGLRQSSATEIRLAETAADYRALHADLDRLVAADADRLRGLGADLLLSNIAPVPLLAARRAGVPAVALGCLNWADIYGHYFGGRPEGPAIEAALLDGYAAAEVFLQPAPSMPMARLANRRPIGPIARRGAADAAGLRRRLGLAEDCRIGLIAFGGLAPGFSLAGWPRLSGWHWMATADTAEQGHLTAAGGLGLPFTDLLASCDLLVTKPGYASFAEAAVNGIPVLTTPRAGWPETPYLVDWLTRHGRCLTVETAELFDAAALARRLQMLFSLPAKPLVMASGVEQAAETILPRLLAAARLPS